jgi:hypothetical protein
MNLICALPQKISPPHGSPRIAGHVNARLRSQENYTRIINLILNNQQLPDKKLTFKSTDSVDQR